MKRRTATLPTSDPGSLNEPPHVLSELIDTITGKFQPSPTQQEQIRAHLVECLHCQGFLGTYLLKTIEYNQKNSSPEAPAQALLARLTHLMHETLKKSLPAYIDDLREKGQEAANRRFPLFADHLQACQDCQSAVRDLRAWLDQLE